MSQLSCINFIFFGVTAASAFDSLISIWRVSLAIWLGLASTYLQQRHLLYPLLQHLVVAPVMDRGFIICCLGANVSEPSA